MRLVLISLDAVSHRDAQTMLSLPHLGALAENGVFCDRVQTVYPTLTYPIHASILTGCYPDRHGIGHNEVYLPEDAAELRPWHWDEKDIQVPTLLTVAARAGRETAAILWPTTGHSKGIKYNIPEILAFPWENQALKVLKYGSKKWIIQSELKWGRTRPSHKQPHLDRFAAKLCEDLILRQYSPRSPQWAKKDVKPSKRRMNMHMPDVIALHLVDCDAMRHEFGVQSVESEAALVRLDQAVGRVVEALKYRAQLGDTVIAVVSDHGQQDIHDAVNLNALFELNGVPARSHTLGLGAYIRAERADARGVYDHLINNLDAYKLSHVYGREELRALHAPKDVLLAVEAREGTQIVDVGHVPTHKATHGFGVNRKEAQTLLWLCGPPFSRGLKLSRANLVDIAPTLAKAAALPFPECQGRVITEVFD